ncbi:MAG: hypothetical protein A4E63_00608 [Syntrophorhabdus sp. PtaU1.Bin050]|nr:MAG: hypothetical protein A4E63_00608 [Syntrophorhabdus sp. PtaU1.Bin050]
MTTRAIMRSRQCGTQSRAGFWTLFLCLLVFFLFFPGAGHSAQITLAWNANTETDLAGYKVYYGTASQNYDWFVDVGRVTAYTVANLTDGVRYYFTVTAYDSSNLESVYSNEVSSSSCTYSISPASATYTASASTGSVTLTTQAGCSWTATSGASWLTITSGSSGLGSGTVRYSVAANTSTSSRSAAITIGGRALAVTQQGTSNTTAYTITASAGTGGTISPSGAVAVTRGASQAFTVTPSTGYRVSYVLVDGTSVGAVTSYAFTNVTANHTIQAYFARTYTIRASAGSGGSISPSGSVGVVRYASQAFTVTPSTGYRVSYVLVDGTSVGAVTSYAFTNVTANHTIQAAFGSCTYSVSATNMTVPASANTGSIPVTTQTGCSWTATSGASWLRITSGSSRSGSGAVTCSIAANTSTTSRTTTLTIAGRIFTVTQRGI